MEEIFLRTIHGMPHRAKNAPHNVVPDYPRDAVKATADAVLTDQLAAWARRPPVAAAGPVTPRAPAQPAALLGAPKRPRLQSSAHGQIQTTVLAYPDLPKSSPSDQAFRRRLYADYIKSFPQSDFQILAHRTIEYDVRQIIADAQAVQRTQVVISSDYLNFTCWIEDPFAVGTEDAAAPQPTFLFKPHTFVRGGDDLVADVISDADRISRQLSLMYQGGNVLVGDTFVLVGTDHLAATATLIKGTTGSDHVVRSAPGTDPTALARRLFESEFDCTREFVFVGTTLPCPKVTTISDGSSKQTFFDGVGVSQPIFHLDMFISLAGRTSKGRYRIVVGSPGLADRILGRRTLPHSLDPLFDDVAEKLAKHPDFKVVRSPLPLECATSPGGDCIWYYATANNCIVEITDDSHKKVWLPQYGFGAFAHLKTTDDYIADLWEKWGFEVVRFRSDYNEVAQCFGAAHCLKKIVRRG